MPPSPKPYMPPLPFPHRFAKIKLDDHFGKFLSTFKKLHANVPFIDALSQMSMNPSFFKKILSKKRKIDEHGTITLGDECSLWS